MESGRFRFYLILLLLWAIISTSLAAYYYHSAAKYEMLYESTLSSFNSTIELLKFKSNALIGKLMRAAEIASSSGIVNVSSSIYNCIDVLRELCSIVGVKIIVHIAIDYGNGTRLWFNSTLINLGETLFNATLKVADVEYDVYPFGVFIKSINGVENNPSESLYWMWWYWDHEAGRWVLGPIGCDKYVLSNNSIVIWLYESVASWPPKPP